MAKKEILIICGEASGDLHAATLAQKILEINPEIKILGVGGSALSQVANEIYYDIKDLSVLGFFDVLKKLPKFLSLKKLILKKIHQEKPAAVIFVDFSGFNLRLARNLNNAVPTLYYISPQIWASRPGRIKTIQKYISKMIVLFKFEEEFYKNYGVDVDFVGHPLLDAAYVSYSHYAYPYLVHDKNHTRLLSELQLKSMLMSPSHQVTKTPDPQCPQFPVVNF